MTLTQLRYFCEVARTKNFTVAAKNLYVAQSSVSTAIKDLETELNLPLFIRRGKRNIELTSYGEQLFPYISNGLSTFDEGISTVTKHCNSKSVQIGCFVNTAHNLTPWLLRGFSDKNVNILLNVQQTFIDMFPRMLQGDYDFIITSNEKNVDDCESAFIAMQSVQLLIPSNSKYAFRKSITIEDIKDETLRFVAPDSYMDLHIKQMFKNHGYTPNIVYSPDYSTLATAVALGKGIALITKMPVDENLLVYVPLEDELSKRAIYASWPTNRRMSDAASAVLNHILNVSKSAAPNSLMF